MDGRVACRFFQGMLETGDCHTERASRFDWRGAGHIENLQRILDKLYALLTQWAQVHRATPIGT